MDTPNVVLFTSAAKPIESPWVAIESIAHLLAAVAWPLALCFGVFLLRDRLNYLLTRIADRLKKATVPGLGEFELEEFQQERNHGAAADLTPSQTPPDYQGKLKKDKVGSLYWLGSDMMAVTYIVASKMPRLPITAILRQCDHHMKVIGFENTPIHERLVNAW
jgi:hypothetical protein